MIAFFKAYWLWAVLAVGAIWLVRSRAARAVSAVSTVDSSARTPGAPDLRTMGNTSAPVLATIREAEANWPGGAGNPINIRPDPDFPGFYISETGGRFNPSTGASYSPGSSPVSVGPSAYDTGAMDCPAYDVSAPTAVAAADDRGFVVY